MPYTQEELKKLSFYQNKIDEDEQQYLNEKQRLMAVAAISGSSDAGNSLIRNEENVVLFFENPYTNKVPEDPTTKFILKLTVKQLKDDINEVNNILNRELREL